MSKSENNGSSGIGFIGALQIAFIVLKLIGKIEWKWLWVLAPTLVYIIIVIALVSLTVLARQ